MSDYFYSVHMLVKEGWAQSTSCDASAVSADEYLDLVIYLSYEENM